ncbi:hypothetical protein BJ684DRAFT_15666, partial [Piptocephalis cylindrospora]
MPKDSHSILEASETKEEGIGQILQTAPLFPPLPAREVINDLLRPCIPLNSNPFPNLPTSDRHASDINLLPSTDELEQEWEVLTYVASTCPISLASFVEFTNMDSTGPKDNEDPECCKQLLSPRTRRLLSLTHPSWEEETDSVIKRESSSPCPISEPFPWVNPHLDDETDRYNSIPTPPPLPPSMTMDSASFIPLDSSFTPPPASSSPDFQLQERSPTLPAPSSQPRPRSSTPHYPSSSSMLDPSAVSPHPSTPPNYFIPEVVIPRKRSLEENMLIRFNSPRKSFTSPSTLSSPSSISSSSPIRPLGDPLITPTKVISSRHLIDPLPRLTPLQERGEEEKKRDSQAVNAMIDWIDRVLTDHSQITSATHQEEKDLLMNQAGNFSPPSIAILRLFPPLYRAILSRPSPPWKRVGIIRWQGLVHLLDRSALHLSTQLTLESDIVSSSSLPFQAKDLTHHAILLTHCLILVMQIDMSHCTGEESAEDEEEMPLDGDEDYARYSRPSPIVQLYSEEILTRTLLLLRPILLPTPTTDNLSSSFSPSDPAKSKTVSETTLTTLTYLCVSYLEKTGFYSSATRGRGRRTGTREGLVNVLSRVMTSCPDHREWILTEVVSLLRNQLSLHVSLEEAGKNHEDDEEEKDVEDGDGIEGGREEMLHPKALREERASMGQVGARILLSLLQACEDGMMVWSGWFFTWLSQRSSEAKASRLAGEDWDALGALVVREACRLVDDVTWPIASTIQEVLLLLTPSLPGRDQVAWSGQILLSLLHARAQARPDQDDVNLPSVDLEWPRWLRGIKDQYGMSLALSWIAHQVSKDRQAYLDTQTQQLKTEEMDDEEENSWDAGSRWEIYLKNLEDEEEKDDEGITHLITLPHPSHFLPHTRERDLLRVIYYLSSSLLSGSFPGGVTDRARATRLLGRLGPGLLAWLEFLGPERDAKKEESVQSLHSILAIGVRRLVDALMHRYSDTSASIREAAVHALGKMCLMARSRSRCLDRGIWRLLRTGMYPLLTQRSQDPSVSVRRRLVEFLRQFYLLEEDRVREESQGRGAQLGSSSSSTSALLAHVSGTILRVIAHDEDAGVKTMACRALMGLWFGPDRSSEGTTSFHPMVIQARVNILLGVAKGGVHESSRDLMSSLSEVILRLVKKDDNPGTIRTKGDSTGVRMAKDVMSRVIEALLEAEETEDNEENQQDRVLQCCWVLACFARAAPHLLVKHIRIMEPYLVYDTGDVGEQRIQQAVLSLYLDVLSLLQGEDLILEWLHGQLLRLINVCSSTVLPGAVACMCRVSSMIKPSQPVIILQSSIAKLQEIIKGPYMGMNLSAQKLMVRMMLVAGLLAKNAWRYSVTREWARKDHESHLHGIFLVILSSSSYPMLVREYALQALGYLCAGFPRLLIQPKMQNLMKEVFDS